MPSRTRAPQAAAADPSKPDAVIAATLQDSAALWEAVQRHSGEFIVVLDRQGIIHSCNRVDDGFTLDQVVGHSLVRCTVPESSTELLRALDEAFAHGTERQFETTVRRLDGTFSYFTLRIGPIMREGRTVAAMACCQNLRPLKDSEVALQRERQVLRRLIEVQERERQLVSYEIHDGLAQYLAGALMHFEAHRHGLAGTEPWEFVEGVRLLRAAAEESRRLIGGLRPPALDELGIVDAIESLVADARVEIPRVTFAHDLPAARLPAGLETTVFRVVQEALSNVRRHAGASWTEILLEQKPRGIHLRISDDGCGFDPAAVQDDRFGLEGIRQRCRLLGGEPRIESVPGQGTTVDVVLPA